jgi:TnpA family transposase
MPRNKNLSLLSDEEQNALYGFPDFNDEQRDQYLTLTPLEQGLMFGCTSLSAQVYCGLQIGYFKAKQAFFQFGWQDVLPADIDFILQRYFLVQSFIPMSLTIYECYKQKREILKLFNYRNWRQQEKNGLIADMSKAAQRDIDPAFLLGEMLAYFKNYKIVRPGYTTLQTLMSQVLEKERKRLNEIISPLIDEPTAIGLQNLLIREQTLSELAAIKQDARNFKYQAMRAERHKLKILKPLYLSAKQIIPQLLISQKNLHYYSSLANYYTAHELRSLQPSLTRLYLLCYVWQRYRQFTDNIVEAFCFQQMKLYETAKQEAKECLFLHQKNQLSGLKPIGRILRLFLDTQIDETTAFKEIKKKAFKILSPEQMQLLADQWDKKPKNEQTFRWQILEKLHSRIKKNLRPLFMSLDFKSADKNNAWHEAIDWVLQNFVQRRQLDKILFKDCPAKSIPKRLYNHLVEISEDSDAPRLRGKRYEFWIYQQIEKKLKSGEIHLEDSINYRCLNHEMANLQENPELLQQVNLSKLHQPIAAQLERKAEELHQSLLSLNQSLKDNSNPVIVYNAEDKTFHWKKPDTDVLNKAFQNRFYEMVPIRDITDILHFVNKECQFLSAFTPLQPRYSKKSADEVGLLAVITALATNHTLGRMGMICDIPYHILDTISQQYVRRATLEAANDCISNATAKLLAFMHHKIDGVLYGSVDGQKYGTDWATTKSRNSRRYFGTGKGVVAYTLLVNHVPLRSQVIGAHQHESYYVFDILYNNTTDINPTAVSGDMHSINRANFAILDWFDYEFTPRLTSLAAQIQQLGSVKSQEHYKDYIIQPSSQINTQLIIDEWPNLQQILVTLAFKETTQSAIIRKLCTYRENPTRKALWEYDKLIRSLYAAEYLQDPRLHQKANRSQNRLEEYHQLRAVIAEINGKKQLTGRSDLEVEISNQCGRLIANVIIYYNYSLLSLARKKYEKSPEKMPLWLQKVSPIAWQHIHLLGHYTFYNNKPDINLEDIIAHLNLP